MLHTITGPATDLLTLLATALAPVGGMAAAIVVLTLCVRAALHPLTRVAVRGERARQRLAPKVNGLRQRHAGDPARQAEESLALHRAEGVSPFAGLWPMLAQAPVFLLLYRVFAEEGAGTLFGEHLTGGHVLVFLPLLAALAVVAWLVSRRTAMLARVNATLVPQPPASKAGPTAPDATALVARLSRYLPYTTVVAAMFVPLALVVYLVTSTAWTLAENVILRRGLPA